MYITHMFLHALSFYEHLYLCISVAPPDPQPTGSLGILPLISTPGTISRTYCIITSYININIKCGNHQKMQGSSTNLSKHIRQEIWLLFCYCLCYWFDVAYISWGNLHFILWKSVNNVCRTVNFSVIWCWFGWDLKMQASWLNLFAIFLVDLSIQSFLTFPFSSRVSLIEKVNLDDQDHKVSCAEITKSKFHTSAPYLSIYHAKNIF